MKNLYKKHSFFNFFNVVCLVFTSSLYSQEYIVEGSTSPVLNVETDYYFVTSSYSNPPSSITNYYWDVSGGGIITESNTAFYYAFTADSDVSITWNTLGVKTIYVDAIGDYGDYSVDLSVTVAGSTPLPPTQDDITVTNNCGNTVLTKGTPQEDNVVWYWQTTNGGKETNKTAATVTFTSSGTYYLRAKNTLYNTWSLISRAIDYTVKEVPNTPSLSSVTHPTCTNSNGSFTITNYNSAYTYSVSPSFGVTRSGSTITAPTGTYTVTATQNGCSATSSTKTVNAQPVISVAPALSIIVHPSCFNSNGRFMITNYNSSYTYNVNPSTGVSQSNDVIFAPSGTYTVTATQNGCVSPISVGITMNAQPNIPDTPLLSSVSQSSCTNPEGSFTITNYNSAYTYSISPSSGAIQSGNTITASAGTYTVTATQNGCNSSSDSRTINSINDTTWYDDSDGDGLGDPSISVTQCSQPANYVDNANDQCINVTSTGNNCTPAVISSNPASHNYIYARSYQTERSASTNFFTPDDGLVQNITYYDGLGRPSQQIGIDQSPNREDIVTHIDYDAYGRTDKEYLPISVSGTLGHFNTDAESAIIDFYSNSINYDNTENPYSQKYFEPSPLNRVLKQGAPGAAWELSKNTNGTVKPEGEDHAIEFGYETNSVGEVRLFRVDLSGGEDNPILETTDDYTKNELYKNITKDENHTSADGKNHTTEEYTDKQGRVILKRTYADLSSFGGDTEVEHDTYYVYDDYGNLTYVLPPKMDASTETLANISANMNELGYQYIYDQRNRLVEKKIPGKGWEHIVYNKLDQPVMTQDSIQRQTGEWLFTKYDAFGRVAYTGKAADDRNRSAIQTEVDGLTTDLWVVQQTTDKNTEYSEDVTIYYDNTAYPTTTLTEVLTINYYDAYVDEPSGAPGSVVVWGSSPQENNATNVKGLATESKIKVLDVSPAQWITTLTYYDKKARPIYTYTENSYLGTVDIVESQLDFVGRPQQLRTVHTKDGTTIVTLDNFTYDHVGRLLKQTQCLGDESLGYTCTGGSGSDAVPNLVINNETVTTDRLASNSITVTNSTITNGTLSIVSNTGNAELIVYNSYDELGQLQAKKVGGVPGIDYASTAGLQTVDYTYNVRGWLKMINQDQNNDNDLFNFSLNYNDPTLSGATALFNGNISETHWETANDNTARNYQYNYDALNRIERATGSSTNYSLTNVDYDKNGNITALARNGHTNSGATSFGAMDNLVYTYDSGNKLTNVADNNASDSYGFVDVNGSGTEYTYDSNGNLTSDLNKGITDIDYNHLNLPTQVTVSNSEHSGNVQFIYAADGTKLRKIVSSTGATTDYAGSFVYENGNLAQFGQPEGYIEPDGSGGYDYFYNYLDHLGSVRLTYSDFNGNGSIEPSSEIVMERNTYPFGMPHKGYNGGINGRENNYQTYLGQEINKELGLDWLTFRYRNYMPEIGRFFGVDPISEEYFSISTYQFAHNSPVWKIELEGLEGKGTSKPDYLAGPNPLPKNIQKAKEIASRPKRNVFSGTATLRGKYASIGLKGQLGTSGVKVNVSVAEGKVGTTVDNEKTTLDGTLNVVKISSEIKVGEIGKAKVSGTLGKVEGTLASNGENEGEISLGTYDLSSTIGNVTETESGNILSSNEENSGVQNSSLKLESEDTTLSLKDSKIGLGVNAGPANLSGSMNLSEAGKWINDQIEFFTNLFNNKKD